ncbi:MAG TPA: MraY family glycosyltransferase [Steroidobacteraceae bacterium]|nr:MraY family glycosyltransferase [Steroidobacteraceae bacterium]
MPGALAFIVAMVVTMTTLPLLARLAGTLGVLDRPSGRKQHTTPIPRVGGLAMALGVIVGALLALHLRAPDGWFLLAVGVLVAFGAWDDRVDLDYRVKFAGQLLAVAIVVLWGDARIRTITLDDAVVLPAWLSLPLTVVFLVGITNAVNLADGLDGLAGGTTFLSLCALALLSSMTGTAGGPPLLLALAGAVLGFLRFNTYPASVFMGDAGSQLLGFSLGVLAIRATQTDTTLMSAAIPVLVLALPILDTLSVIVHRISEGRSPFRADKNHIHHRLLALGFAHHEAVMVVYAIQAALFIAAYLLRFESDVLILAVVLAFFAVTLAALHLAERTGWRLRASGSAPAQRRSPARTAILAELTKAAIAVALGAYAALIILKTPQPSSDIRLVVGGLLAAIVAFIAVMRAAPLGLPEKCVLFVTAAVLVYLDASGARPDPFLWWASWVCIGVAALATAIRLRLLSDRRFQVTPLDLIILFMALVVPNLPGSMWLPSIGSGAIAKLVIVLYSLEVLVSRTDRRVIWFRLGTASVLAGLTVRPLLFS